MTRNPTYGKSRSRGAKACMAGVESGVDTVQLTVAAAERIGQKSSHQ